MTSPTPDPRTPADHENRPGVPRWVKFFGIIAAAVVVLVVVLLLAGHGPARHGAHAATGSLTQLDARR